MRLEDYKPMGKWERWLYKTFAFIAGPFAFIVYAQLEADEILRDAKKRRRKAVLS